MFHKKHWGNRLFSYKILFEFFSSNFFIFVAFCFFENKYIDGYDMSSPGCTTTTKSAMECHQLCTLTQNCRAFTWFNKNSNVGAAFAWKCCLKTAVKNLWPATNAISGSFICAGNYHFYIQFLRLL